MEIRQLAEKMLRWKRDPIAFVREVLRAEPDVWQAKALEDYRDYDRVALVACKGPGKSTVMSWIGWHFLTVNINPKVIATSITGDNLKDGLWTEFALWQQKSLLLKEMFQWQSERIFLKETPETWWASARTWPKDADKTTQANAIAGLHANKILFLLDEVAEYPEGVVAAAEAALSTGESCKMVVAGNPTTVSGPLYRIATKDAKHWRVHHITGDPNRADRAPRVSKEWAKQQREQWGIDSNYYRINVLGEFPLAGQDQLIDITHVRRAVGQHVSPPEYQNEARVLGLDVARFGTDRSVLFPRQGPVAFAPTVYRELDLMDLVGRTMNFVDKWRPDAVFVDQTGLGSGVVDRLRELGAPVIGVEAGSKALRKGYRNKRVEMWVAVRDWLKLPSTALPNIPELIGELTAPSYKFDSAGVMTLESKADLKARGLNSPDLADALALTFAAPVLPRPQLLAARTLSDERRDYNPVWEERSWG